MRPAAGRVHHDENIVMKQREERLDREHGLDISRPKAFLKAVKSEPAQFRLNQVGPVRHDLAQSLVLLGALPSRYQMQHMHAAGGRARLFARIACQFNLLDCKQWQPASSVLEAGQAGFERMSVNATEGKYMAGSL